MVKLSKTPIDESQLALSVVNHDVVRLHISVHNTLRVTEVKGLEDLVHVVSDIEISETLVKSSEVNITCVDVLHDQGRGLGHRVSDNIDQVNDVDASSQSLKNFDLSSDLGLLNY